MNQDDLIRLLETVIDEEMQRPEAEMNCDLIDQCVDALLEMRQEIVQRLFQAQRKQVQKARFHLLGKFAIAPVLGAGPKSEQSSLRAFTVGRFSAMDGGDPRVGLAFSTGGNLKPPFMAKRC